MQDLTTRKICPTHRIVRPIWTGGACEKRSEVPEWTDSSIALLSIVIAEETGPIARPVRRYPRLDAVPPTAPDGVRAASRHGSGSHGAVDRGPTCL